MTLVTAVVVAVGVTVEKVEAMVVMVTKLWRW